MAGLLRAIIRWKTKTRFCPEKRTSFTCPSHLAARHRSWTCIPIFPAAFAFRTTRLAFAPWLWCRRSAGDIHQPAGRLSNFCALRDINVLLTGLAQNRHRESGYRQQCNTSKKRMDFMRVNFLSIGTSQPRNDARSGWSDTQARERVIPPTTPPLPGLTPEDACHRPAAATRVFDVCSDRPNAVLLIGCTPIDEASH